MTDPELDKCLSLHDFEAVAETRVVRGAWARVQGGAADEITLRWNREAWQRIRLRPRILMDVSKLDTRVNLFGQELPFPILLAPTGAQGLIYPNGDLEVADGAAASHATLVISSSASLRVEEIARHAKAPVWFQLYVQRDRAFTKDLMQRAEDSGCRAICVTIDSPTHGARDREQRAKGELPVRDLPNFASKNYLDPTLTWKDIDWLMSFARTPVLLKGILNAGDAETAVRVGVAGIVVSNHGGRNLDTAPATAEVLPRIVDRLTGRVPVIVDGGIRRGTDVLKALALGAAAVQIGRPYLHGLGVAGAEGVARVVRILRDEFESALMLAGCPTLASIDRSLLW
ncbi:MAG: alpha-hydroxy acid oxidase [Bryobacteraceae bacterium]